MDAAAAAAAALEAERADAAAAAEAESATVQQLQAARAKQAHTIYEQNRALKSLQTAQQFADRAAERRDMAEERLRRLLLQLADEAASRPQLVRCSQCAQPPLSMQPTAAMHCGRVLCRPCVDSGGGFCPLCVEKTDFVELFL